MTLVYAYPAAANHITPPGHPERVDRLAAVEKALNRLKLPRRDAPLAAETASGTMRWKAADTGRLQIDSKSVDEASRLLAKMQSDPIEERLTRLERRADTIVALLQQVLDAVRPDVARPQQPPKKSVRS